MPPGPLDRLSQRTDAPGGDRMAVDFEAVFFAVDLLVAVFFLGDRLAVALAFFFVAVFLAPAAFFFGDRLAVALVVFLPAGFFLAADFDAVFFFVAINVAPMYQRLFSFQSFLGRRARKDIYGSALRNGEG